MSALAVIICRTSGELGLITGLGGNELRCGRYGVGGASVGCEGWWCWIWVKGEVEGTRIRVRREV